MNVIDNICPVCKTRNEFQAEVCVQCGTKLEDPYQELGHRTKTTDMQAPTPEIIRDWTLKDAVIAEVPETGIAVYIEGRSGPVS